MPVAIGKLGVALVWSCPAWSSLDVLAHEFAPATEVEPAGQSVHEAAPATEVLPAGQLVHADAPAAEYVPAAQLVQ